MTADSPRAVEIDVYAIDLTRVDAFASSALEMSLAPLERQRADRFVDPRARMQFVVGRACARAVLSERLGTPASSVELVEGAFGKPALAQEGLQFNISHSHEWVVVAVSAACVGVDVERIRAGIEVMELARQNFSSREIAQLRALSDEARLRLFYDYWTRKEAVVKAIGGGLTIPLAEVDVAAAVESGADPARVRVGGAEWFISELRVANSYAGAVAADAEPLEVRVHGWGV